MAGTTLIGLAAAVINTSTLAYASEKADASTAASDSQDELFDYIPEPDKVLTQEEFQNYLNLFGAWDMRFTDYYDDNIQLRLDDAGMVIETPQGIIEFYEQYVRPHYHEHMDVLYFVADKTGVAAKVQGTFTCVADSLDDPMYGTDVYEGQYRVVTGLLLYEVKDGKFTAINSAPTVEIQGWTNPDGTLASSSEKD